MRELTGAQAAIAVNNCAAAVLLACAAIAAGRDVVVSRGQLIEIGGVLEDDLELLAGEPPVRRSVRAGAALTTFSGDKLLGGPQAGLLVGTRAAVEACRRHPLARAVRIDKLSLAALEATLALHRDPAAARRALPVLAMLEADDATLSRRAHELAAATGGTVVASTARVGGGALPLLELPGPAVAIDPGPAGATALAADLRAGDPAVVGRLHDGRLLLDPRTLTDDEARAVRAVALHWSARPVRPCPATWISVIV